MRSGVMRKLNLTEHSSIQPGAAAVSREVCSWMRSGELLECIWHNYASHLTSSCLCVVFITDCKRLCVWRLDGHEWHNVISSFRENRVGSLKSEFGGAS
jgi:hypothetical protein